MRRPTHLGRVLVIALTAVGVTGCAPDIHLRRPQTGETTTCRGGYYTYGLIGLANQTPKELQLRCLEDYQRQAYERVPD